MKTNSTTSFATQNTEVTLGWNSMPSYGEVMNTLVGTNETDIASTIKLTTKTVLSSFWSTLSNLK